MRNGEQRGGIGTYTSRITLIKTGFSRNPCRTPLGLMAKARLRRLTASARPQNWRKVNFCFSGFFPVCFSPSFPGSASLTVDWYRLYIGCNGTVMRMLRVADRDVRVSARRPVRAWRRHWPRIGRREATAATDMVKSQFRCRATSRQQAWEGWVDVLLCGS